MTQSLRPYPAYKDSGVPWLGEVPEHWSVVPNRATFGEIKEGGHPDEPMLSVTITRGVIPQSALLSDTSKKDSSNEDRSRYKLVCPGDITYNKMRAWQGAVGSSDYRGIVSPAYIVMRPRDNQHPRFFHYLFRTPAFAKEAERWSYGISSDQWSLRTEEFGQIYSCVPSLPEQTAIVRYLDYMDRRIRRYINARKKLIALLNEQKQAVIHQAVTRGLDPNVRLKPSGVEWLGDVPEHWEVRRLRYAVIGKLTYGANVAGEHSDPEWPRYLRITDFASDGAIREDTFCSLPPEIAKDYLLKPGDILLARSGATVGKAFRVTPAVGSACHAGYLIRARPNPAIVNPGFLFAFTQTGSFRTWKDSICITATIQNIGADRYANLYVPIPPLSEQTEVVDFIASALEPLNAGIARAERGIELALEYRTSLVTDVITGKLDVREVAASLPDEAEEELDAFEEVGSLSDNGAAVEDGEEELTGVTDEN